ncbi:hypothetical protein MLD38_007292 [Melastoma candidum]|uniref:Uncharacterized protein n=1 Tax=Melastoma candidum TaxID=119954 RepID=A0ACB9RQM9_9MYRT|nr:hypothetical protein MLD38_007292 [Melastoma candidum]
MQAASGALLSPQVLSEIRVHGFLLWTSFGLLMPIGTLIIRVPLAEDRQRWLGSIFPVHASLQIVSAVLATVAAVLSIKNFDNSFNNYHQRIGIALYGLVWLQGLVGILRPLRGCKERRLWFALHWALGTVLSLLGVINIYTGLLAYRGKTSRRINLWLVLFTAEISSVVIFYLIQDKWPYIRQQGAISCRHEPVTLVKVDPSSRSLPDDKPKEAPV